ncbi:hypothetical protein [Ferrimicrobium sp.]|uniref:hypothetical protein n=1 Tax=Ferrimicrobium sp. TaxID=2926050 RepID=UPI002617DDCB|nr:hypothetical protein [Ferrimicrobium sp.]
MSSSVSTVSATGAAPNIQSQVVAPGDAQPDTVGGGGGGGGGGGLPTALNSLAFWDTSRGTIIPLRQGNARGFGETHIESKHQLYNMNLVTATFARGQSEPDPNRANRWVITADWVNTYGRTIQIKAVESQSHTGVVGPTSYLLSDPFGVVTAYCQTIQGVYMPTCPLWVNDTSFSPLG